VTVNAVLRFGWRIAVAGGKNRGIMIDASDKANT
jgi:hypothetical protein